MKSTATRLGHWGLIIVGMMVGAGAAWATSEDIAEDVEYGAYLAGECLTCHSTAVQTAGIPAISGRSPEEFVRLLNEYKTGTRKHPVMQTIAGRLGPEEIAALAAYFATNCKELK